MVFDVEVVVIIVNITIQHSKCYKIKKCQLSKTTNANRGNVYLQKDLMLAINIIISLFDVMNTAKCTFVYGPSRFSLYLYAYTLHKHIQLTVKNKNNSLPLSLSSI